MKVPFSQPPAGPESFIKRPYELLLTSVLARYMRDEKGRSGVSTIIFERNSYLARIENPTEIADQMCDFVTF